MTEHTPCRHLVVLGAQHPTGLMTARALRGMVDRIDGVFFARTPCESSNIWTGRHHGDRTAASILSILETVARTATTPVLLLPADDESVLIVSEHREELPPRVRIIMPDRETVSMLLDKSRFYAWAEPNGFLIPRTAVVTGFKELAEAVAVIPAPCLLKPLYRTALWDAELPRDKVFILDGPDAVATLPPRLFSLSPELIVQPWIPGTDAEIYFCLVYYDQGGKLVDSFCGRKLLQWPPVGGSTAIAVSDEMELTRDATVSLFDRAGYRGLGSMEYKRDPRDGKLYIMEPTVGRNDFQSWLAVTGNVNLTACALQDLNGRLPGTRPPRRSSLWISELSTFYSIKHYLRKGDLFFLRFAAKLLRPWGCSYFQGIDPRPFTGTIGGLIRKKLASGGRGNGRG